MNKEESIFGVIYNFHAFVDCMCAAAYLNSGKAVQVVENASITEDNFHARDVFIIPIDDEEKSKNAIEKITNALSQDYLIDKAEYYKRVTDIDPFDLVVCLNFSDGITLRRKSDFERGLVL